MTREDQLNRAWADLYKANEDVFLHAIAGHDCEKQRAHREKMRDALAALGVDVYMRLNAADARSIGGDATLSDQRLSEQLDITMRTASLEELKTAISRKEVAAKIMNANHATGELTVHGDDNVVEDVEFITRRWRVLRANSVKREKRT